MNNIYNFLSGIKLTLVQYALITEAVIIGFLVVLLELKGSELHKAQVDALEANYLSRKGIQDGKTSQAQQSFIKALKDYQDNQ